MRLLSIAVMVSLSVLTSCCSAKKNKTETTMTETEINTEAKSMMADGYIMGEVIASKTENDCPFVIKSTVDDTVVMYDAINLDKTYMKGGMKVWYKFNPLRMMNRCEKANPVSLVDMKPMM